MTIRTIDPPLDTTFGPDSPAQFAEVKSLKITVDYRPTGIDNAIEQWAIIEIVIESWQGGSSAASGASPLREDYFRYEVESHGDVWPLTTAQWDSLRQYCYDTVMADTENPTDDPQAFDRGTVFLD